jgi:radical SAM superfamily enzyme YgiQ (UPF0313 family)
MPQAVFVDLNRNFYDPHGIYSLSSVMKKQGIAVDFVGKINFEKAISLIISLKPDILLYSATSTDIPMFRKFDYIVKRAIKVKSIIGGPGATFDWKCITDSTIDAFCIGEGEIALIDFIQNGFTSNRNIFYREEEPSLGFYPFVNLDELPFPDREVIYRTDSTLRQVPSKQFLSGRGCPNQCTYCFNHKFIDLFKGCGPLIRKKSVSYLFDEIRQVREKYPLMNIVFNDDTFIIDKKWFMEFSERFPREIGLTYTCNIRSNLMDEEIAKALRGSNCIGTNWSIESGNEYLRNVILKRNITTDQVLNTAGLLTKYKIPYRIGNLVGIPSETFQQVLETVELNIRARPFLGFASIFVPFPGLELTRYAIEQGYYRPRPDNKLPKNFLTKSVLNISAEENKQLRKITYLFPVFVRFPFLFQNLSFREALLAFPVFCLRLLYEICFAFRMVRLYRVKAPFFLQMKIAARYIINTF